jgi:hypothetical protein
MNAIANSSTYVPQAVVDVCGLIRHRQRGLDRVEIQFDSSAPNLPLKELKLLSHERTSLVPLSLRFQRLRKTSLHLFQPSTDALRLVRDRIGNEHGAFITYAEPAIDFVTRSDEDSSKVQDFLLAHLHVPSWQQEVRRHQGTYYFASRWTSGDDFGSPEDPREDETKPARRRAKNFALYADCPTKLHGEWLNRRCAHFEIRLSGTAAIAKAGIGCIDDLIDLDYDSLWERMVGLKRFTSLAELGASLDTGNAEVSGEALRKRARRFMSKYTVGGSFVLQNAIREDRRLAGVLTEIPLAWVFSGR